MDGLGLAAFAKKGHALAFKVKPVTSRPLRQQVGMALHGC